MSVSGVHEISAEIMIGEVFIDNLSGEKVSDTDEIVFALRSELADLTKSGRG